MADRISQLTHEKQQLAEGLKMNPFVPPRWQDMPVVLGKLCSDFGDVEILDDCNIVRIRRRNGEITAFYSPGGKLVAIQSLEGMLGYFNYGEVPEVSLEKCVSRDACKSKM